MRATFFAVAAALASAGCATAPAEPLPPYMSPYPAGKYGYGYGEERLTPDTWRVTYQGPWQELATEPAAQRAQIERAAMATSELALWRASQLVLANGKSAYTVIDRRTDTETQLQPAGYAVDPFWPHYSLHDRFGRWPYWHAPLWREPAYVPGRAGGRAKTTLTVRFAAKASRETIDAAETAQRLQQVWGGRAPAR